MAKQPIDRVHQLEDELKIAKQRNDELRQERDEGRELVQRLRQRLEDNHAMIDSWIEAFSMELGDDGAYHWQAGTSLAEDYGALLDRHNDLVRRWNKLIAKVAPLDVGRPLNASEADCAKVLKLHAQGVPYRLIVDEVKPLSMQTVRTIIGREHRTDRTTVKRLERLGVDKTERIRAKARARTRDALPKRINEALRESAELITEAKGLGKR